jgi:GDPmannose 4,6-dehydratase
MDQLNKKALIFGISGQDGSYLARLLHKKNYIIHGTSRNASSNPFRNLKQFKIYKDIWFHTVNPTDKQNVIDTIKKIKPLEIYNLSGQSSVSNSFLDPQETFNSITQASLNILEAIKLLNLDCKFYNAGSSECFGDTGDVPSNETTSFNPCSPYGVAKSSAFWLTKNYRDTHNIFACSGILFNHESPLRPENFVTRKIIRAAVKIYLGKKNKLILGDLSIKRDWGWAPDYVEAMWLILQINKPEDFVISTGVLSSLEVFVENVFLLLNLDWKNHTEINKDLFRPSELKSSVGDARKAKRLLKWEAKNKIKDVIVKMINFEIKENENQNKDFI